MPAIQKIFVVIDPTTESQPALSNAETIALSSGSAVLHVYECIFSASDSTDPDALRQVETSRHRAWLDSLVKPLVDKGLNVEVEIEWNEDWRDALPSAARRLDADLIVKAASVHSGAERRFLKTSDWTLLRNSHCPVYLIKKDLADSGRKVLVALDIKRSDDLHNTLNERVLEFGRAFVGAAAEGSLHAVNAYSSSNDFVYPDDLAETTGIQLHDAHSVEGAADTVIPEVTSKIEADILVIGTAARDGIKAAMLGNTAEKVVDAVDTNILIVTAA